MTLSPIRLAEAILKPPYQPSNTNKGKLYKSIKKAFKQAMEAEQALQLASNQMSQTTEFMPDYHCPDLEVTLYLREIAHKFALEHLSSLVTSWNGQFSES